MTVVAFTKISKSNHMAQTNLIPYSIHNSLPAMVRDELSRLAPQSQAAFVEEYRRKSKSTGLCYLLWITGSVGFGFQYAYVGKWGIQILYWLTFGGLLIWWFIDLFRIPGMVGNYNKDVAVNVLGSLKAIQR